MNETIEGAVAAAAPGDGGLQVVAVQEVVDPVEVAPGAGMAVADALPADAPPVDADVAAVGAAAPMARDS